MKRGSTNVEDTYEEVNEIRELLVTLVSICCEQKPVISTPEFPRHVLHPECSTQASALS